MTDNKPKVSKPVKRELEDDEQVLPARKRQLKSETLAEVVHRMAHSNSLAPADWRATALVAWRIADEMEKKGSRDPSTSA